MSQEIPNGPADARHDFGERVEPHHNKYRTRDKVRPVTMPYTKQWHRRKKLTNLHSMTDMPEGLKAMGRMHNQNYVSHHTASRQALDFIKGKMVVPATEQNTLQFKLSPKAENDARNMAAVAFDGTGPMQSIETINYLKENM